VSQKTLRIKGGQSKVEGYPHDVRDSKMSKKNELFVFIEQESARGRKQDKPGMGRKCAHAPLFIPLASHCGCAFKQALMPFMEPVKSAKHKNHVSLSPTDVMFLSGTARSVVPHMDVLQKATWLCVASRMPRSEGILP
jgi:hypothetical protein